MNELEDEIFHRESILSIYDFSTYNIKRYNNIRDTYDNLIEITRNNPDHRNVDTLLTMKLKMEQEKNHISTIMSKIRQYPISKFEVINPLDNNGYILQYKGKYMPFNSTYRRILDHLYEKLEKMKQKDRELMVSSILSAAGYHSIR
jgi:hypothetical protein